MHTLALIRARILSPARMRAAPATATSHRGSATERALDSSYHRSSLALSGPTAGRSAGDMQAPMPTTSAAHQNVVRQLTGAGPATSALTSFMTRRTDSDITD
ncbi:hypothetical protein A5775_07295 [Mycobacterium sp. 852002-10029_SCH5224772]|nr:hypothetical protein A5775_07295 [Mycobacterium sp. 852002-10029_SCH5224772]